MLPTEAKVSANKLELLKQVITYLLIGKRMVSRLNKL